MKRAIAILAALTLILSLTACATQADVDDAYKRGYDIGNKDGYEDGYEAAKKEWVGYYSQIAYTKGYTAGNQDALMNINAPYSAFKEFNKSDEATVYDDPLAEVEREIREAYKNGYNDGLNKSGVSSETRYIEVPKFYSEDQEEMYDEIWDEVYERAREDFESEYGVDNDY